MRKSLLAFAPLALGAFVGTAMAEESSVTLYGILDAAMGHEQHSLNGSDSFAGTVDPVDAPKTTLKNSSSGMFNGGLSPSRWGIKGTEVINDNLKAFFLLESGFNLPYGTINNNAQSLANSSLAGTSQAAASSLSGQFFSRQAYLGISDATWGSLRFGRNYVHMFDQIVAYDPVQAGQLFSPLGFSGSLGGGAGATESMRSDNSIKYGNTYGPFSFGALYKFANSTAQGSGYDVDLAYTYGPLSVEGTFEKFRRVLHAGYNAGTAALTTQNAAVPTGYDTISVTDQNDSAWQITAKYKIDKATLRIGDQHIEINVADNKATLGATSTSNTLAQNTAVSNAAGDYYGFQIVNVAQINLPRLQDIYWGGADYDVSPALNIGVGYYLVSYKDNDNYVSSGGQHDGIARYMSLLADYKLSKRTDVYAGTLESKFGGVQFTDTTYYHSNNVLVMGMRHRF